MTNHKKDRTNFWNNWQLKTDHGRQWWDFQLPDSLKGIINSEKDWQKPEGKKYLEKLSEAFIFNKKSNPNSGDKVYRNHIAERFAGR